MTLPFTPRFADLVRTYTHTQGTEAFMPGAAVPGFSSFADALREGDQFYYCAQSVTRPAEREVGRGTLLADGSIAREAVDGALTSFSAGTKTVALVAAAEWFSQQSGRPSDTGVGLNGEPDRAAIQAKAAIEGAIAYLAEPGREGLFAYRTGDFTKLVAADVLQGLCIAAADDPEGTSGAWVRQYEGAANVRWFGAKGDGVTDDLPAFDAALQALAALAPVVSGSYLPALQKATPKLHIPTPRIHYYLSSTWNIFQQVHVFGDGSGAPNAHGTVLRFGINCNGIVVNEYRTSNDEAAYVGDGSGSIVEGLTLLGGNVKYDAEAERFILGDGSSSSGHGVRVRGSGVTLRDICVKFFAGDGINIFTSSGAGDYAEGNGNSWRIDQAWLLYNDGNGLRVRGPDSNVGIASGLNAIQNRLFGVRDDSFLGNQYNQPHCRDNGLVSSTGLGLPTGTCLYQGACYSVALGNEARASTTVPGTDALVWLPCQHTHPYAKQWVSGMTWEAGGPIASTDPNAYNLFNNAYAESGQAPIQAVSKALFFGGVIHDTPIVGIGGAPPAPWLRSVSGDIVVPRLKAEGGAVFGGGANVFAWEMGAPGTWSWRRVNSKGKLALLFNNRALFCQEGGDDNVPYATTFTRLRVATPGSEAVEGGLELGYVTSPGQLVSRTVFAGEFYHNAAPSDGGPIGWIARSSGPGSTATFAPTGIVGGVQGAPQADSQATDVIGLKADFNALLATLRAAKLIAA